MEREPFGVGTTGQCFLQAFGPGHRSTLADLDRSVSRPDSQIVLTAFEQRYSMSRSDWPVMLPAAPISGGWIRFCAVSPTCPNTSKREYGTRPPRKFIGSERDDVQVVVQWLTLRTVPVTYHFY